MNNNSIKVFIAGDFCSKPSTTNITVEDELVTLIKSCDISIVNFEVPLKPSSGNFISDGFERFFQNDDAPDFLKNIGFTLFSIANNHMFDWEEQGFLRVKDVLGDNCFGAGTRDEAYKIKVVEVKNKKIGFLALCYGARKGVFTPQNDKKYGCAHLFDLKVNHIIVEAKKELDYLFILPHAGIEYHDAPTPELISKYRDFIEWGADGVIASHPHCPQGWETHNDKPIFYSLGNFFFNSKPVVDFVAKRPHWYEGLAVIIELSPNGIETHIINTRNTSNRRIGIDTSSHRITHNKYLCNLLKDDSAYKEYLSKMVSTHSNMLNTIANYTMTISSMKSLMKLNAVYCKARLQGGEYKKSLLQLLKQTISNETNYELLRKYINNK